MLRQRAPGVDRLGLAGHIVLAVELSGDWKGHRELHVLSDWLLVYYLEESVLVLTLSRTGTHSDIFKK